MKRLFPLTLLLLSACDHRPLFILDMATLDPSAPDSGSGGKADLLMPAPPSCTDGKQNGDETGVDCGGSRCEKCDEGKGCKIDGDCKSGFCDRGVEGGACRISCTDMTKNGDETDVDCGGSCAACDSGKGCKADKDCKSGLYCTQGACLPPASCADVKTRNPAAASGEYTIQPSGGRAIKVACDMTTEGGGWTLLLQCLPGDSCKAGNVVLQNVDWLAQDYGAVNRINSYAIGKSLSGLLSTGHFMVQVSDPKFGRSGALVYPLNADTVQYFSAPGFYESARLPVAIIDTDGTYHQDALRLCWNPLKAPFARSVQGRGGLQFLGRISDEPNERATGDCDYGAWGGQMLMRNPVNSALTTMFGMTQPVANWSVQQNEHRIWIRESIPTKITIVDKGQGRVWSDGLVARSCLDYRNPPDGARAYAGAVGSGVYTIKPDASANAPAFDTYCDMDTDGGGWTMVQRTVWDWSGSKPLMTGWGSFYNLGPASGNLMSGYRLPGAVWPRLSARKDYLVAHHPRRAQTGMSCGPLFYKATNGTLTVDPVNKAMSVSGHSQSVPIFNGDKFSTVDSGPSQQCTGGSSGVPWFYSACCNTCPTYQGGYWLDEPHPMVSYTATVRDLIGNVERDVCKGDAVVTANGNTHSGMNKMEFFIR